MRWLLDSAAKAARFANSVSTRGKKTMLPVAMLWPGCEGQLELLTVDPPLSDRVVFGRVAHVHRSGAERTQQRVSCLGRHVFDTGAVEVGERGEWAFDANGVAQQVGYERDADDAFTLHPGEHLACQMAGRDLVEKSVVCDQEGGL